MRDSVHHSANLLCGYRYAVPTRLCVAVGGDTVFGQDCLELLQSGIGAHTCGVEVSAADPEAGFR